MATDFGLRMSAMGMFLFCFVCFVFVCLFCFLLFSFFFFLVVSVSCLLRKLEKGSTNNCKYVVLVEVLGGNFTAVIV